MRIALMQISSGKFLNDEGGWTEQAWKAKHFDHFLDALVYARDHLDEPVGAYCMFQDPSCNFSVYLRDASTALLWEAKVKPLCEPEALPASARAW